jgi:hypothetical protein
MQAQLPSIPRQRQAQKPAMLNICIAGSGMPHLEGMWQVPTHTADAMGRMQPLAGDRERCLAWLEEQFNRGTRPVRFPGLR